MVVLVLLLLFEARVVSDEGGGEYIIQKTTGLVSQGAHPYPLLESLLLLPVVEQSV